jgi:transcriptional regulator with XRE-family HTH domain
MNMRKTFSTNIRKARFLQKISQEKLAEKSKLHRTYISSVERCQRNVSIDNMQKIAEALNVPLSSLLKE